ncbi:SDR family NAD(P)-dependent oxidoreductase [Acinetobacter sp. ANC 3791]|uniref:SDR family NAD(P)-dependent oxidoreductase n=1 Tax=Acinetobacter sp. ANC 3791 TaxID=2529836 RepID=UPI001040D743|nr:SDR family NAD(P)-dependent oxidoreductase [Acinetobacter sp. ANC 3791]TCB82774.1 SDR family NAD(P)-dependent oxidoreductase [Acinetobacter sp. ANC 3791]
MKNNIIIFGYGLGISRALAYRFGQEGYIVGLVARDKKKLEEQVLELRLANIDAHFFCSDLSQTENIPELIHQIKNQFGEIKNIHWNAFHDIEGDLLTINPFDLTKSLHLRVSSYIATVQACMDDLKNNKGCVLSTNGVFALDLNEVDLIAKEYAALSIAATSQYKTTNLLALSLKSSQIYVGQVIVNGFVEGTPGVESKLYTIAPKTVADQFWDLHQNKNQTTALCGRALQVA